MSDYAEFLEKRIIELEMTQAAPIGYVLVPVDLTPEMVAADPYGMGYGRLHAIYQAMLAAAPASAERVEQEPFAWATFDGEGSYDLRMYECNEEYQSQFLARHKSATYKDWVFPLYTAPQPSPDVARLVQALENVLNVTRGSSGRIILDEQDEQDLRDVLSAHRQQEQSHER
jgi:hypothetical protein